MSINKGRDQVEMPSGLVNCKPMTFQLQSMSWMLEAEQKGIDHSMWTEVKINNKVFYMSLPLAQMSHGKPTAVRGGLLAEAMGLGKTVICLGLILLNPAPVYHNGADPFLRDNLVFLQTFLVYEVGITAQVCSSMYAPSIIVNAVDNSYRCAHSRGAGMTCDDKGCGCPVPIVGNLYHKIGHDYDLCEKAFSKLPSDQKTLFEVYCKPGAPPHPYGYTPRPMLAAPATPALSATEAAATRATPASATPAVSSRPQRQAKSAASKKLAEWAQMTGAPSDTLPVPFPGTPIRLVSTADATLKIPDPNSAYKIPLLVRGHDGTPTDTAILAPADAPTLAPPDAPTVAPTDTAILAPVDAPTLAPPVAPTVAPTDAAILAPAGALTLAPTVAHPDSSTRAPPDAPTVAPYGAPRSTVAPSDASAPSHADAPTVGADGSLSPGPVTAVLSSVAAVVSLGTSAVSSAASMISSAASTGVNSASAVFASKSSAQAPPVGKKPIATVSATSPSVVSSNATIGMATDTDTDMVTAGTALPKSGATLVVCAVSLVSQWAEEARGKVDGTVKIHAYVTLCVHVYFLPCYPHL